MSGAGYKVTQALTFEEARNQIRSRFFPIVLCDIHLAHSNGLELMPAQKNISNQNQLFIFITGEADVGTAISAIRNGAFEYLSKPNNLEQLELELISTVNRASKRLLAITPSGDDRFCSNAPPIKRIVGRSSCMVEVYRNMANAALHQGNVLILGETGTGKEQIAKTIHAHSHYSEKPFIAVNCGALADTLLESELFGHVKGAFTGAISNKRGLFEEAAGGTIFLDEIGDISLALQVKLLRTIQEKEIKPVGSNETRQIDVRVIAATNKNLEHEIKESRFREDLYFRLKVFLVEIPPLRHRLEDLPELIDYFIADASAKASKRITGLSNGILEHLMRYSWPGNVRELENAVTRAVVTARSHTLYLEDFPKEILCGDILSHEYALAANPSLSTPSTTPTLAELERNYIFNTLQSVNFKKSKTAEILGIDRVTLYRKICRYGIPTKVT